MKRKTKRLTVRGWVGFSDGVGPHKYRDDGILITAFYGSEHDARLCYDDVRPATLTIDGGKA
jgi:hypothetical protein